MKIDKKIEQVLTLVSEASTEEAKASAVDMIKDAIGEAQEAWEKKVTEKDEALANAQGELDSLKETAQSAKEQLESLSKELEEIKLKAEASEKEQKFQNRMSEITEKYELSEAEVGIVSSKARDLDDEEYSVWYNEFSVIASAKDKEAIKTSEAEKAAKEKELQEALAAANSSSEETKNEESQASAEEENVEDKTEEVLNNTGEGDEQSIANAQSPEEETKSLTDQFKDAFGGESMKIEY
jgi:chromosome segregation ATPase